MMTRTFPSGSTSQYLYSNINTDFNIHTSTYMIQQVISYTNKTES